MSCTLVVGGTGFIGQRSVTDLFDAGVAVKVLSRRKLDECFNHTVSAGKIIPIVADLGDHAAISNICDGVDTVFHLAGYAHADEIERESAAAIHRRVTVEGTRALIEEACRAGVRRFVFISSVKAMGEGGEQCLDETARVLPTTAYGRAKLEAEQLVLASSARGMHVSVLRLPLVYGRGVKGNLLRMIKAVDTGRFPPLPEVNNRRSMVHVDDVVRAIRLVVENPRANGQVYLVTDGRAYSTSEICALMRRALGRAEPKWNVPIGVLRAAAGIGDVIGSIQGRPFIFNSVTLSKLIGSAWYSSEKIERDLDFRPTHTFEKTLPEMVEAYRRAG